MSLISCHSSHVSSLRHSSHVSHLMSRSQVSSHVTHLMSDHCVTHLMSHHYSLILSYCLYTLGRPHLTSAHDLCLTSHSKMLLMTSGHPLHSNLCPTSQRPSAQKDRNRVSGCLWLDFSLDLMSLISCLIITSLNLASSNKKRVKQRVYSKGSGKGIHRKYRVRVK